MDVEAQLGLVKQEGGSVHAWVLNLPGCIVGGRSMAELETKLPLSLSEFVSWLRGHGENLQDVTSWQVAEVIEPSQARASGGEYCFEADRAPVRRQELEQLLERATFSRTDLLASCGGVPDVIMDWRPPRSSVRSFDPWADSVRSIREILKHVLQLEIYYRGGLRDGPAPGIFEPVKDADTERDITRDTLMALPAADLHRVFSPIRPSREVADCWTVRKVVRRIISHERAHAAEIVQRRTWLLLGVPAEGG